MIKHLDAFIRGIHGIPYGESIMPMYRFADPNLRSSTSMTYFKEQRGENWWYKREIKVTHPGAYDETHYQWFGPYQTNEQCEWYMSQAKASDVISPI